MSAERVNQLFRLSSQGIDGLGRVFYNLNESELLSEAVSRKEGELGIGKALLVNTGEHTGRSPNDRFIVKTEDVADKIWWENNQPMTELAFDNLEKDLEIGKNYKPNKADWLEGSWTGLEKKGKIKERENKRQLNRIKKIK